MALTHLVDRSVLRRLGNPGFVTQARAVQRALADMGHRGRKVPDLLLSAVTEAQERRVFFAQFSARYDELRTDPTVWGEIEAERSVESGALTHPSPNRG